LKKGTSWGEAGYLKIAYNPTDESKYGVCGEKYYAPAYPTYLE
jgi:hypothetical protein